ncbi:MAG: hypothetical protein H6622_01470 [Halobacteriovoraceae bacterium]|nr:hypothetical protein [Halobacteriovoraceae bacterium]
MGSPKYKQRIPRTIKMQNQNIGVDKRNKSVQETVNDKKRIESLREIIAKKISSPELARKAAQIISEMLKNYKK